MSISKRSIKLPSILLTSLLFVLFGCAEDSAPTASNNIQAAPAMDPEPSVVTAERASEPQQERIVMAQADVATSAGRFQLGEHYNRLPAAQGTSSSPDQIEVAEVFWYGCPHCYTFDPYLENWRETLPEDVNFVRIPAVWNPLLEVHARAFYAAEALNVSDELHTAFFREIHINRNGLDNPGALADFFAGHNIDADAFTAAYESFSVNTKMNRANELSRRYRIASVPTVIVNGKYTSDASMAGSYEDLMELIDELVAMERGGQ
jgi:thiol:disulfide interchange protein DsbA